jgi:two-component system, CitB family, sensor histidine kinase MalK
MGWKRPIVRLRTRITLLVCLILLLVLVVTGFTVSWRTEQQTLNTMTEKTVMLSRIAAESEAVVGGLQGHRSQASIQAFAERLCERAQVDYVVVLNMNRIRLSHPNPSRIGAQFVGGDDADVYRGLSYTSMAKGTLGLSMRAFTPVFDPKDGHQIGAVAVGILVTGLDQTVVSVRKRIALGVLIGFAGGILGAMYVAGRIKKILMGMEPSEIATMLQQRSALLHSVREGVVAVDRHMAITVVNEEASRLFGLAGIHGEVVGRSLDEVLPGSGMRGVLEKGQPDLDRESDVNGLRILTSCTPVLVDGEITGVVATFRDKTEVSQLAEQLTGVRLYADALRAQTHEFMNKLHVILGLIRLEEYESLKHYIISITGKLDNEVGFVIQRIKDPVVAGFLLARFASAREQNITMNLDEASLVPRCPSDDVAHDIVTIVGNLLENAVEAIGESDLREIHVSLRQEAEWLDLAIQDTGSGLPPEVVEHLFEQGCSTKGKSRGYGLWQAARTVESRGGKLQAANREPHGAAFTASLLLFPEEAET